MQLEVGAILEGKVTGITKFGAFVELPGGKTGMVHISEVAPVYVKEIRDHVKENDMVKVEVLTIAEDGKVSLSIKRAMEHSPKPKFKPAASPGRPDNFEWSAKKRDNLTFEDMMSKFKQSSEEKMSDLKRSMDSKSASSRRGSCK